MLIPGLTSVTFRKLSCSEIITLTGKAGLPCIEWGGDVHVSHGDLARAREVKGMMADSGIQTSSYGSYYRCNGITNKNTDFEKVLETALELNAPLIRVWAGEKDSNKCSKEEREAVVTDSRRIAGLAFQAGVMIGFEFHGGTLNANADAARRLIAEIGHPNVGTYWQAPVGMPFEECCTSLRTVLPSLRNIHVFHWGGQPLKRMLLSEGKEFWRSYLELAGPIPGDHHVLLEFVQNDDPSAFMDDARALKTLIA